MKQGVVIFLMAFIFTACGAKKEDVKIEEFKWVVEKMGAETVSNEQRADIYFQFDSENKRVGGKASCNRFFGAYELNGNELSFSQMGATRMACMDMELESKFLEVLELTDSFQIKDGKLILMQGKKELATFQKESKES